MQHTPLTMREICIQVRIRGLQFYTCYILMGFKRRMIAIGKTKRFTFCKVLKLCRVLSICV
jgi:hypothetical protein